MPTVTVQELVTLQQAATALHDKLGNRYVITTHGPGAQEALKVKQSAAALATVHLDHDGNTTTFHVDGGELVISRMINEFGIAKKVAEAIEESFKTWTGQTPGNISVNRYNPATLEQGRRPHQPVAMGYGVTNQALGADHQDKGQMAPISAPEIHHHTQYPKAARAFRSMRSEAPIPTREGDSCQSSL